MPFLPAHCDHCGIDWDGEGGIRVMDSVGTVTGGQLTCPKCRRPGRIIEGTFDIHDEIIDVLAGPDWTIQTLRQVHRAVVEAEAVADRDPTAAIAIVEQRSSSLAAFLRKANEVNTSPEAAGLKAILKWVAMAIAGVLALKEGSEHGVSVNQIVQAVEAALRQISS